MMTTTAMMMRTARVTPTPIAIFCDLSPPPDEVFVVVVVDAGLTLTSPDADDIDDIRVTDDGGVGTFGFVGGVRLDNGVVVVVVVVVVVLDP